MPQKGMVITMSGLFFNIVTNIVYLVPFSVLTLIPFWGNWKFRKPTFFALLTLFNVALVAASVAIVHLGAFEHGWVQNTYGYAVDVLVFLFCLFTTKVSAAKLSYVFFMVISYLSYEGNVIFFIESRFFQEHFNAYDGSLYIMLHSILLLITLPFVLLFFIKVVKPIAAKKTGSGQWKFMWIAPATFWLITTIYVGIFDATRLSEYQFLAINILMAAGSFTIYYITIKMISIVESYARTEARATLKTFSELIELRDSYTGSHVKRTQNYLGILIDEIVEKGIFEEAEKWDVRLLISSARLHDVGKIGVSDSVLNKPGKLTDEEFEQIKTHSPFGVEVLNKVAYYLNDSDFLEYAVTFAETHHEKWDGSGYPHGLQGNEIPLIGRIMAIADVYDALVSERPYKKPFTHEKAIDIIESNSGTHFDPTLVEIFLTVADKFKGVSERENTLSTATADV